jgi:2-methylcitrate dehydratase PrpD
MDTTSELMKFVCKTRFEDLPLDVIDRAKMRILDTLGGIIFSADLPWSQITSSLMQELKSQGKSTIVRNGAKTSAPAAALINGTMGHGFELDDVHEGAQSHPGGVVIPAALSVGEQESVDGRKFLLAVIMGYEVMCRVGMGVGAKAHMVKGFHPTGTSGNYGATAAAGKILGLSEAQLIDAMGICGSTCSGIMQFTQDSTGGGEMIKRLHAGWAAQSGVLAALLAQRGFRGPCDIVGGKYGFCRVFSDRPEIELTNQGLGAVYEIMNVGTKPYPCCTTMHSTVDGVASLRDEFGLKWDEIDEIRVGGSEKLIAFSSIYEIDSAMAGQYSIPYVVALTLVGDIKDPKNFKKISDDEQGRKLRELVGRTKLYVDEELDGLFPKIEGAKIAIRLKSGRSVSTRVLQAKGNPNNPLSPEEICEKFSIVTRDKVAQEKRQWIIDTVRQLEMVPNIAELTRLLA